MFISFSLSLLLLFLFVDFSFSCSVDDEEEVSQRIKCASCFEKGETDETGNLDICECFKSNVWFENLKNYFYLLKELFF